VPQVQVAGGTSSGNCAKNVRRGGRARGARVRTVV